MTFLHDAATDWKVDRLPQKSFFYVTPVMFLSDESVQDVAERYRLQHTT